MEIEKILAFREKIVQLKDKAARVKANNSIASFLAKTGRHKISNVSARKTNEKKAKYTTAAGESMVKDIPCQSLTKNLEPVLRKNTNEICSPNNQITSCIGMKKLLVSVIN